MKRFLTASKIAHRSSHESDRSALEEAVYYRFGACGEEINR
jgi:hypothetical protein